MAFGSRTVAQRDVDFNVNLGSFRAQLGEADQLYRRTTGSMSNEALRLSVKQYDLTKAVKTYGSESVQAARKAVSLREEMDRLSRSSERSTITLGSEERALGRFSRGTLAAAGVSGELRRALLLGSSAFLGGYGFVAGLHAAIKAAEGEQVAISRLQVSLKNAGLSWKQYGSQVEEALSKQVKSTAFNREDLTNALAANVTRFGNINQALKANAIDADVARQKNISLADAQTLIQRASAGQSRSLLALGITFTKTTANVDALKASTKHATAEQVANAKAADLLANRTGALAAVQEKYHGAAQRFLQTTAGKQALSNAEVKQSEEIIGQALLPEFNRLITRLSAYLDKINRTGQLQRDVNHVLKDAGVFFHDAETAAHGLHDILSPLNSLLGGTTRTIHLLIGALIAFKLKGALAFAQGAKEIGGAATIASGEVNALAGAEARAAGAGAGAAGAAGLGSVVGRVGLYTGAGAAGAAAAGGSILTGVGGLGGAAVSVFVIANSGERGTVHKASGTIFGQKVEATISDIPGGGAFITYTDPVSGGTHVIRAKKGDNIGQAIAADIRKRYPTLSSRPSLGGPARPGVDRPSTFAPPGTTTSAPAPKTSPAHPAIILGLSNRQQTGLLRAEGTPGTADDLAQLDAQLSILSRLVRQRGLNAQQLNDLLAQRNAVQDQITAIIDQNASKAKTAGDRAKAAAKRLADERKKAARERAKAYYELVGHDESGLKAAVERAKLTGSNADDIAYAKKLELFYRHEANDPKLNRALRDAFKAKDIGERLAIKKLEAGAKVNASANIREFLSEFQNVLAQYGPNFQRPHVTVNQYQSAASADPHRDARRARIAHMAAFDN